MSLSYNCDMCKDSKSNKEKDFTMFTLQIRTPNWVNVQYHICPECMEKFNIKELKSDTPSAPDRLLDILKDIVSDEVQEALENQ